MEKWFLVLGTLCTAYFAGIALYAGLSSKFPFFWLFLGLGFFAGALCLHMHKSLPGWLKYGAGAAALVFAVLFLLVEAGIVREMFGKPEPGMDYLVVLGAQVKGEVPSQSLQYRIDKAEEYLKENPRTRAVLSGGKGYGEGISEAECMYRELVKAGVEKERLVLEDRSVNTKKNIAFSYGLIQKENPKGTKGLEIGIVTNGFHVYRGKAIAQKAMDCEIQGVPAKGNAFLQVNYMVREFLGILKDKAAGNL